MTSQGKEASDPEGWRITLERIAREAKERTGFLDLGELGLRALPEELFDLKQLRRLNLGSSFIDNENWSKAASDISSNDPAADLERLAELPELEALSLSGIHLDNLSPLAGLAALQSLDCSGTPISDLSPLAVLTALQSLTCWNTPVSDLSPLAGLAALRSLICSDTPLSDLSPLASLTALRSLECWGTPVSDLSPLAGLTALRSLDCSYTSVSELSPLAGLTALQSLDCSDTPISDLSPLADLSNLETLAFSGCRLTRVPKGLWNKPSLRGLVLHEAKIPGLPAEVLSQQSYVRTWPKITSLLSEIVPVQTAQPVDNSWVTHEAVNDG